MLIRSTLGSLDGDMRENKGDGKLIAWTKEGGPMWKKTLKQIEAGMNKWNRAHKKVASKIKKKW